MEVLKLGSDPHNIESGSGRMERPMVHPWILIELE